MRFEPLWHSLSPCLQYDFSSSVINLLHAIAICAPPTPQHPRLIPISSWHGILRCPFGIMLHWFCCPSVHFGSHFGSSLAQYGKPQHLSPIFTSSGTRASRSRDERLGLISLGSSLEIAHQISICPLRPSARKPSSCRELLIYLLAWVVLCSPVPAQYCALACSCPACLLEQLSL